MFDVATAFRRVIGLAGIRCEALEHLDRLVERDAPSRGYIEYFSRRLGRGRLTGQQVCVDRVVNVGEVTALLSVAENRGLLTLEHERDEFCQHSGIRRRGVLPRTEDVEIPQSYGLQAVAAVERNHVVFARQLGYRVRRDRIWRHAFV